MLGGDCQIRTFPRGKEQKFYTILELQLFTGPHILHIYIHIYTEWNLFISYRYSPSYVTDYGYNQVKKWFFFFFSLYLICYFFFFEYIIVDISSGMLIGSRLCHVTVLCFFFKKKIIYNNISLFGLWDACVVLAG